MRSLHRWRRLPLLLSATLLAPAVTIAATAPDKPATAEQRFSGKTEVVSVEVPVNVVDRNGKPLRGLTSDSFEVYDEGKRQAITSFELVDLEAPAAEPAATHLASTPAPAARRHFLLLFDLSFSSPTAIVKARLAAREFVLGSLHPNDLVGVATYSLQQGPRLVVTFTPDRAQVARGIDTLGLHTPEDLLGRRDPLRFMIATPEELLLGGLEGALTDGSADVAGAMRTQRDQAVLETMRAMATVADRMDKEYAQSRVATFTHGMGELARALNAVSGRKEVVMFSQGFDSRLMLGDAPESREAERDTQNIMVGNIALIDSDNRYGNTQVQNKLFKMLEEFRRADCVVQTIDISGLRADITEPGQRTSGSGQETLFYIANETGGELFRNANDFGDQLRHVLARSEVTYLLTFERSDLEANGAYRRLRVEGKGLPSGTRLSYRTGYYAPRPFKDLDPIEKNLLAGDAIANAVPRRDLAVHALAAPFRATPKLAYVPVVLELQGNRLLAEHTGDVLDLEIYTYASDAQGKMRDFFTQSVKLDLSKTRRILGETGLKYYGHLDLPPGEYRLRVLVRDGQTGRTGVESLPLTIPAYAAAEPFLLPPLFIAEQDGWLMLREKSEDQGAASVVYPFTLKGEPYVPAAHPVLGGSERADLCLVGYNLGAELRVEGKVLGGSGEPLDGGRLSLVERTPTGLEGVDKLHATFDAGGLSAGDYVLQVAVEDKSSGRRETSSLAFTVR
jgi:VWFA-related protein